MTIARVWPLGLCRGCRRRAARPLLPMTLAVPIGLLTALFHSSVAWPASDGLVAPTSRGGIGIRVRIPAGVATTELDARRQRSAGTSWRAVLCRADGATALTLKVTANGRSAVAIVRYLSSNEAPEIIGADAAKAAGRGVSPDRGPGRVTTITVAAE